jgi:hypothetical protein
VKYLVLLLAVSCGGTYGNTCASGEPLVCGRSCVSGEFFICGKQCAPCEEVTCGPGQFPQCGCLVSGSRCAG